MWDSLVDSAQGHSKVWERQPNVHSHSEFCRMKSSLHLESDSESKKTVSTFSVANILIWVLTSIIRTSCFVFFIYIFSLSQGI